MRSKSFRITIFVCLCVLFGTVSAEIVPDIPFDPNALPMQLLGGEEATASLDYPNAAILVYQAGDESIISAMTNIGATNVRYRNNSTPITQADWQWCDIFVLASNGGSSANLGGLDTDDVETNIVGRVVLTGHDADLHAGRDNPAGIFMIQAINYVMAGDGKGAFALGDSGLNFDWTPPSWGIESTAGFGEETVTGFTSDGLATGIYDDLTKEEMSNWSVSFHVRFDDYSLGFKPYETGYFNGTEGTVTIGCSLSPFGVKFDKEDGLDDKAECVVPEDEVTYTICFDNLSAETLYEAFIVDFLPPEMDYPAGADHYVYDGNDFQFVEGDPIYNDEEHYYVWELGTISPDDANCVTLDVVVNNKALPGMLIHNRAELWGSVYDPNGQYLIENLIAVATEDTQVCCWGDPNFIYVDETATGENTGMSWQDAYVDLGDALQRANETDCSDSVTIYVAQGTYDPNQTPDWSFVLPDGCRAYGGFKSGGCEFSERNPKRYITILTGLIDNDAFPDADTVVTMGQDSMLDGFTVTKSADYGIYGSGVDFDIENCRIEYHDDYGIFAIDGNVNLKWCLIQENGRHAIYHDGDFELVIENSQIRKNEQSGVFSLYSATVIKNCVLSENGLDGFGWQGLRLIEPASPPVLYNNTLAQNKSEAVFFVSSDPNYMQKSDYMDMQNCLIWSNNCGEKQLTGLNPDRVAAFCCIQDCNEVNFNINLNPKFAYKVDPNNLPDPNNLHLAYDSPCIDAGNPFFDADEVGWYDMDNEERKIGNAVDIGADEVYSCDDDLTADDIYNPLDANADGLINYEEFAFFSAAWLSHDPNDPSLPSDPNFIDPNDFSGWSQKCNLIATGDSAYRIDLDDLREFIYNGYWLWTACWKANEIVETQMMTASADNVAEAFSFRTVSFETTSLLYDATTEAEDPYAAMSTAELVSLVQGIYAVLDAADTAIAENDEILENWLEIKEFLEEVLNDIKESRR